MDPRCYFSDTPLRKLKQSFIDSAKQRARLSFLRDGLSRPLLNHDDILSHYDTLLDTLRALGSAVTVLGLLSPDERTFPGSGAQFLQLNARLQPLAARHGAEFVDWQEQFTTSGGGVFYRDGFHPSAQGAMRLAEILHAHLLGRGAA
jgi:lysophospholipase L1-like esterase